LTSVGLVLLVLGLHERLRAASPALSAAAGAFGYLGAGLLILNWGYQYAEFHRIGISAPAFAERTVATNVVYDATNNTAFFALGVWILLVSWAALRRGGAPRWLAYAGVLVGALNLAALFGVPFGLLLNIVWFIAIGVTLLQQRSTALEAANAR
jgi:hypothetical protein